MLCSEGRIGLKLNEKTTGVQCQVIALNGVGKSEPFELQLIAPGERQVVLEPGMRVRAVWAGCLAIQTAYLGIASGLIQVSFSGIAWNNILMFIFSCR